MDFKDAIKQLAERVIKFKDQLQTEEATKTSLVIPFFRVLGYDETNPSEVIPEYIADLGIKKGEKIDYAILKEGVPVILVEAKHWAQKLDAHDNQLIRYFHASKAKFAILTNGIHYRFFTDLVDPNKMDVKPFFEFDITAITEQQTEELKKFHKSYFDIDTIVSSASELKYTNEIKAILQNEFKLPSETFVKFFATQVYPGKITQKILFQFSDLVRRSITQVISEMITDRLKSALDQEKQASQKEAEAAKEAVVEVLKEKLFETTGEEMEGFYIIKSILRQQVDSGRIDFRDAQSYFAILLDNNNRKSICRLYLSGNRKYIGTFDAAKNEVKNEIASLDDIYNFSDVIRATVETYLGLKS